MARDHTLLCRSRVDPGHNHDNPGRNRGGGRPLVHGRRDVPHDRDRAHSGNHKGAGHKNAHLKHKGLVSRNQLLKDYIGSRSLRFGGP